MRPTVFGLLLPQNFMLAWHCNTNAEEWLLCKISYHQMLKSLFDISHWRGNHIVPCQHTVIWSAKMLRGARMAGLVKLHRSADRWSERRLRAVSALRPGAPEQAARRAAAWPVRAILPNAAQCTNVGSRCSGTGLEIASSCEILSKHNVNVARSTSCPDDGVGRCGTCVVE